MESLDTAACFMDELLNFSSDIDEDDNIDDEDDKTTTATRTTSAVSVVNTPVPPFPLLSGRRRRNDRSLHFPEIVEEEELEWISNKDAFPMVESFVDILPTNDTALMAHRSPISVLDHGSSSNSSSNKSGGGSASACVSITTPNAMAGISNPSAFVCLSSIVAKVPVKRARSKLSRRRRKDVVYEYWHQWSLKNRKQSKPSSTIGRKCLHCGAEKTPQWRAGPSGPKTLCNACGVRYKSGRLCAEYRPANSPSFSGTVHSNSHRKILEMRRQKEIKGTKQVVIG